MEGGKKGKEEIFSRGFLHLHVVLWNEWKQMHETSNVHKLVYKPFRTYLAREYSNQVGLFDRSLWIYRPAIR